jgi:transcriptional regulator with XRE-family HTH domain
MTTRTRVSRTSITSTPFGATLRRMRLERGLRQRDLAGDDISPSYISFLESGRRAPTERVLRQLAERLSCDVAELRPPASQPDERPSDPVHVDLRMAWVALLVGYLDEAEHRFQQVADDHRSEIRLTREAEAGLARVRELTGRHQEAATLYEKFLADSDETYPHRLACTIGLLRCLARLDDHDSALQAAARARHEVESAGLGVSDIAVEICSVIASIHCELGQSTAAKEAIEAAMRIVPRISSREQLTRIYWQASAAAQRAGMPARALELAERIAETGTQDDYAHTVAMLYAVHGALLLRQDDPDPEQAHGVLGDAIDRLRTTGTPLELVRCQLDLVRSLVMLERLDEADSVAGQLIDDPGTPPLERVRARLLRAATSLLAGDITRARETCHAADGELETMTESPQTPRLWTELGEMLAKIGDPQAAVRAYRRATRGLALDPLLSRSTR